MKKVILLLLVLSTSYTNAQAFKGKGDIKGQIGMNIQNGGSGITVSTDLGIGENMSVGLIGVYMLNADKIDSFKPRFEDRADLRVRFNANIGNVFKLPENVDVYPGLSLGFRNFGGHLGGRYFFTNGFGVFSEVAFPLASYDSDVNGFEKYNNQFVFHLGVSFNL